MDYEAMLKKGRENLPESVQNAERFEIPKVQGHIEGSKTVITNFNQIAGVLRREVELTRLVRVTRGDDISAVANQMNDSNILTEVGEDRAEEMNVAWCLFNPPRG